MFSHHVVGILGPRQVGKSTLLRDLMDIRNACSLDDRALRTQAQNTPDVFLASQAQPLVIDEIQKAPHLFDAIKLKVDKQRIPGSFCVTGSANFSTRIGIRESLTGRIGTLRLLPMTLSEMHNLLLLTHPLIPQDRAPTLCFDRDVITNHLFTGGFPVPGFMRDVESRRLY